MHLHGYKMEILETYAPNYESSCNLAKCKLADIFSSEKKMEELQLVEQKRRLNAEIKKKLQKDV